MASTVRANFGSASRGLRTGAHAWRGGSGKNLSGRDRALQRLVVLKRYHGVASPGRREAVLNEGRALARVRSPFVAPCYGVESRGDEIDLVVEYVPGRPLNELTADERADFRRCARLVEQVAAGLAEVHACGLLHRDIKPQNIILGDDGLPRLVDFGLAVPVASEALQDVSGSPRYMAPEQARGQGERVDARTDVFGLGGVLYDLLTGQPPRDGTTLVEVLEQARGAAIVPPRRINPRIPRSLERICLKAMAADPKLRFPSADAMRLALRRYRLTGQVAPLFAAAAVLLTLLGPIWAFWPRHARHLPDGPGRASAGGANMEPPSELAQSPRAELRVTRFEIPHFPKLDAKHYDPRRAGTLGRTSFGAHEDDEVIVRAELSEPAYAYLIAFRPDGTDELCDPDDEDTPPPKKPQATVPAPRQERRAVPPERRGRLAGVCAGRLAPAAALVPRMEEAHRANGVGRQAAVRSGSRLARRRPGSATPSIQRKCRYPGQGRQGPRLWRTGRETGELAARPAGCRCRDPRSVPRRAGLRAVSRCSW